MNKVHRDVYARLYEEAYSGESLPASRREEFAYAGEGFEPEVTRELNQTEFIREAVEKIDQELSRERGLRLRPDSKLFLLLNFNEMIARPLASGGRLESGKLLSGVEKDLRLIVQRAAEEHRPHPQEGELGGEAEISSHYIVNALSRSWADLHVTGLIWD